MQDKWSYSKAAVHTPVKSSNMSVEKKMTVSICLSPSVSLCPFLSACLCVSVRCYCFCCRSNEVDVITPAGLLFSFLLPKVYPPLFSLYALFDAKDDERYWKRVRLWNKQSNLALMAYLGVDRWVDDESTPGYQQLKEVNSLLLM